MRRFHAFNVGLPRTGTTSIAAIFSNYRSAHEFDLHAATRDIADHASGRLASDTFAARARARDVEGDLEMNSSSFNHAFLDVLLTIPEARFIFTLRDCWSWTDSLLHMFSCVRPMPAELVRYAREGMEIPLDAEHRSQTDLIGPALAFWARANQRVLDLLPADRSLVLRTADIGRSLPRLADFVDVPLESLRDDHVHSRRSPPHWSALHALGAERLETLATEAGCKKLMREYFTNENAALFLERNAFLAQFQGTK